MFKPFLPTALPLKALIVLVMAGVIILFFIGRLNELQSQVELRDEQRQAARLALCDEALHAEEKAACAQQNRTEKHRLFDAMMQAPELVRVEADGSLTLAARDYLLAFEAQGKHDQVTAQTQQLFERLYGTTAGKVVRQQIAWWNHSRRFAAIRDNAVQGKQRRSGWLAKDSWEGSLSGRDVVPLAYGYVNAGKIPQGFNDWLSVTSSEAMTFTREVSGEHQTTLNVQIIGYPDISTLSAYQPQLEACWASDAEGKTKATCQPVSQALPDADVYRLRLSLSAAKRQTLSFTVKPAGNQQLSMDGLSIRLTKADDAKSKPLQLSDFTWSPLYDYAGNNRQSQREQFRYQLATADGTLLFDSQADRPASFTKAHGLLSLVGYDTQDRYALAGMLARAPLKQDQLDVRLTLDAALQQQAHQHLQDQLKAIDPQGRYADQRRAAVVFIKPQTGAILAAANYPNPPGNVNRWDRLSFSKLYPTQDKFLVPAWQGLDNNNTPGSVFKMVTALAGMQAAEAGADNVESMIEGLKARPFKSLTGLPVTAFSYQPDPETTSKVHNAGNASMLASMPHKDRNGKTVYPALRTTKGEGCPSRPKRSKDLGMQEAVRDSLNVWFARMAVMMDENNLASGGKDARLVQVSQQLGFGGKTALAQVGSPLNPQGKLTEHAGRGTVLSAYTGDLTLRSEASLPYAQGSALQRLTQNSFGQGVATTPLQMARVAATVATGEIPQPYILQQWGDDTLSAPERRDFEPDGIEYLRAGMKAVPEVGTAERAFRKHYPEGKCRTFGKTGTAQVVGGKGKRSRYSAWFTGWLEDEDGKPEVAFACMVSHTYRKGHSYGGEACAPIIARTLRDLAQTQPSSEGSQ